MNEEEKNEPMNPVAENSPRKPQSAFSRGKILLAAVLAAVGAALVILGILIARSASPSEAEPQIPRMTSDLVYALNEEQTGYIVTGAGEEQGNVLVVPAEYEGKPVVAIGNTAFRANTGIVSAILPESVKTIADSAFAECSRLASVSLPGVSSIGRYAFYGCTALTSLQLPPSLSSTGYAAFAGCRALTSLSLAEGVRAVEEGSFVGCTALVSLTLPDSVESVGVSAFAGCTSLSEIQCGTGLASIADGAFSSCVSLARVSFSSGLRSIGTSAFAQCSALGTLAFPDSLTAIGDEAFYACPSLSRVSFGKGLSTFGEAVFASCPALSEILVPAENENFSAVGSCLIRTSTGALCFSGGEIPANAGIRTIAPYALVLNDALETVVIPEGVTSVGRGAFGNCTSLRSVSLPASLETIEENAFAGCTAIESVTYAGTSDEWSAVSVGDGNTAVTSLLFPAPTDPSPEN